MAPPHFRRPILLLAGLIAGAIWIGVLGLGVFTMALQFSRARIQPVSEPAGAVTLTLRAPDVIAPPPRATSAPAAPAGSAALSEIVNAVEVRASTGGTFAPATPGLILREGSQVRTGAASGARLDFGGGAIVRLAQNTAITLETLTAAAGSRLPRLALEAGTIWINMSGSPIEVSAPAGTAAAHGAFAAVTNEPGASSALDDDVLVLSCFKGPCTFLNETRNEAIGDLQQISIRGGGREIDHSRLTPADVQAYVETNPEGESLYILLTASSPVPTDTPIPTPTEFLPTETMERIEATLSPTDTLPAAATATSAPTQPTGTPPQPSDTPASPSATSETPVTPGTTTGTPAGTPGTPTATLVAPSATSTSSSNP